MWVPENNILTQQCNWDEYNCLRIRPKQTQNNKAIPESWEVRVARKDLSPSSWVSNIGSPYFLTLTKLSSGYTPRLYKMLLKSHNFQTKLVSRLKIHNPKMGQSPIDNINNKNKDKDPMPINIKQQEQDPMPITCLLNSLTEKLQRKTKYRD